MITDDIKRLNYYEKQFLGARDFRDEQSYHIEMRRRHLIGHHLWGIVAGLNFEQDQNSKLWSLRPGAAIDGYGREILVFDPEPLDMVSIGDQLAGAVQLETLKIWIAYKIESSNKPPAGFTACDQPDQFMRIRETFRMIYQDNPDPPFDLGKQATATNSDPNAEINWPVSFQDLPDDPLQARWPVFLGTLTWDPAQKLITTIDQSGRRYVGVVAAEIEAPNNSLRVYGHGNPSPLPTDPNDPKFDGLHAAIEGELNVQRRLTADEHAVVKGTLGVGTTVAPADTRLQVVGGNDATLDEATGYVVIGDIGSKNVVLDNHAIMARDNKAPSDLQLQAQGGDLGVHRNQAGKEFVIKDSGNVGVGTSTPNARIEVQPAKFAVLDSGNVGIGTTSPGQLLTLVSPEATRLEIARTSATLPWSKSTGVVNEGAFVINQQSQGSSQTGADFALMRDGKKRVILGDTDTFLSSQDNGRLRFYINREEGAESEVMHISAAGNVGIGTSAPTRKLEVVGDLSATNLFGSPFRIFAGRTTPGATAWQAYFADGISVDVNTSAAGFTSTPLYIVSLHGSSHHWATTGGSSVYNPTPTGFRIYVRFSSGANLTPTDANTNQWHIQWVGIQL
jgi:hypothetical protein